MAQGFKDRIVHRALPSVGVGLIIGPTVAYSFNVLLYILGKVSHFALRQWEEPLMIGWCISIPAGALIGGLNLNYRTSLAIGSLCGLLFAYSLFGVFFWQSRGNLPYYPDLLWMAIIALQGMVMALLIRWSNDRINKKYLTVHYSPYEPWINWLAIGTFVILLLLWGIGRHIYIASRPSKEAQAHFIAIKFQPDPVPQGKPVNVYAWVDSKEPVKSAYLIDPSHNVHMLRPSSQGNKLLFIGKLIPPRVGFQRFIATLVTPSGVVEREVFLYVQP